MSRRNVAWLAGLVVMAWSGAAVAGPVDSLTNWLREQFIALFNAFREFMVDLFVLWLEQTLSLVVLVVSVLPPPDFLSDVALCTILANAGPWAQWAIGTFHVGEAMGILAAALLFRLARVFLTLFQWT